MSEATLLLELQETELEIMRLKKALDSLPEKELILEVRKRKNEALKKRAQIVDLADEVEQSIDAYQEEDAKLSSELSEVQTELENTSDYRRIKTLTRQMEGIVKRREKIEFKLGQLAERSEKVDAATAQIAQVLEKLNQQEETLTRRYQAQGSKKLEALNQLEATRNQLAEQVPPGLLDRYEKLLGTKGGIAAAKLEHRMCSVCHVEYQEGQLAQVLAQAPIATCPNCNRILVVLE